MATEKEEEEVKICRAPVKDDWTKGRRRWEAQAVAGERDKRGWGLHRGCYDADCWLINLV